MCLTFHSCSDCVSSSPRCMGKAQNTTSRHQYWEHVDLQETKWARRSGGPTHRLGFVRQSDQERQSTAQEPNGEDPILLTSNLVPDPLQGTWEFMSARMLEKPSDFMHEPRDDLESFVHVIHHTVSRSLGYSCVHPPSPGSYPVYDLLIVMNRSSVIFLLLNLTNKIIL